MLKKKNERGRVLPVGAPEAPVQSVDVVSVVVVGRQRVGALRDNNPREILQIKGQGSYPRFKTSIGATFVLGPTPKNGRKWPKFQFQNRPKPRVSN